MYQFTALVSLLAILFYFFTSTRVARARAKFGVAAPAITGNADFERVFRVQMNTLEWLPILMVSLWLSQSMSRRAQLPRPGALGAAPARPTRANAPSCSAELTAQLPLLPNLPRRRRRRPLVVCRRELLR